jgi:hypothetical protein
MVTEAYQAKILGLLDELRADVILSKEQMDTMVTKAAEEKTATSTRDLNAKIKTLTAEINELKTQVELHKQTMVRKDKTIKLLETQLAERAVSSWL